MTEKTYSDKISILMHEIVGAGLGGGAVTAKKDETGMLTIKVNVFHGRESDKHDDYTRAKKGLLA